METTEVKTTEATKPLSLTERMKLLTQTKNPGASSTASQSKSDVKTNPTHSTGQNTPTQHKMSSAAWNSDEDFSKAPEAKKQEETNESGKKVPTEKEKRGGARSIVGTINMTQRIIFTKLADNRFKKKFSLEEMNRLDQVADASLANLDDEDRRIRNKFDRLIRKHNKTLEGIQFSSDEVKDFEEAFYLIQDESGKALPVWLFALFAGINSIGKRAMDIYFD
jgi:hypothetical protein